MKCEVEGCSSSAIGGSDRCSKHGAIGGSDRWKRCVHEDCKNGAVSRGRCIKHGDRCEVEDCSSAVRKGGKCWKHRGK